MKRNMKIVSFICFFLSLNSVNVNANTKADSLQQVYKTYQKKDTTLIQVLHELGWEILFSVPDSAIQYAKQGLSLSKKLKWTKGKTQHLNLIGTAYAIKADYPQSIFYFKECLSIALKTKNKELILKTSANLGNVYYNQGNLPLSLSHYFKSLKIAEEIKNNASIGMSYNSIAGVYAMQGEHQKALDFYFKSLKLLKGVDENQVGRTYGNIGNTFTSLNQFDKALTYYLKSHEIAHRTNDKHLEGISALNIGNLLYETKKYDEAEYYYKKSIGIADTVGNKQQAGVAHSALAKLYLQQNNLRKAETFALKAIDIAKEIGDLYYHKDAEGIIKDIYKQLNQHQNALQHFELYIQLRDSINSEENHRNMLQTEMKHEYEKKAAADSVANAKQQEIKNVEIARQKAELKAKRNQQFLLFGGLALVIIFALFMYNRFKITARQKKEIEKQKLLVEEKQKEILDSIHYAKRIQMALLPNDKYLEKGFKR